MRVGEYLAYRASLKGVYGRRIPEKVQDALDLCGLAHVQRQVISTLSKGYRQRVGLADALVNEPDILILDEPTIGLDPNQIHEVRELIKGLAVRHTILLSSHILSEVEMTCSRVLIINKGRIVAAGTPTELRERSGLPLSGAVRLEVLVADPEYVLREIAGLNVGSASLLGRSGDWALFEVLPAGGDPRSELFDLAVRHGWKLRELSARESSLEEIFRSLIQVPPVASASVKEEMQ